MAVFPPEFPLLPVRVAGGRKTRAFLYHLRWPVRLLLFFPLLLAAFAADAYLYALKRFRGSVLFPESYER